MLRRNSAAILELENIDWTMYVCMQVSDLGDQLLEKASYVRQ